MHQADVLILQLVFIGGIGYLFSILLSAMGRREFGMLLRVATVVLCVVVALQLVAMGIQAVTNFLEPIMRFLNKRS